MIPAQNIVAWGNVVPWADQRQVEQDLIISRAVVEIFSDELLRDALRFRGGTALNKLHFPTPLRYSEDIDLVRTSTGPIGPILDQLGVVLEPWLGRAQFDRSPVAPKFRFRVEAEDDDEVPWSDGITENGNRHDETYIRLLDADSEGLGKNEMTRHILGIDPAKEPERARKTVESHLERARWMTEVGYRHLAAGRWRVAPPVRHAPMTLFSDTFA